MEIKKLSNEEIEIIRKELVKEGIPVRFLYNGQNINIESGCLLPKNTNVINQIVYWNFALETIKKISNLLGVKYILC